MLSYSTSRVNQTDAGAGYVTAARRILEQIDEQECRAAGGFTNPSGELGATTPTGLAA